MSAPELADPWLADPTALALAASLRAAREAEDKARFAAALRRVSGR